MAPKVLSSSHEKVCLPYLSPCHCCVKHTRALLQVCTPMLIVMLQAHFADWLWRQRLGSRSLWSIGDMCDHRERFPSGTSFDNPLLPF